MDRLTISNKHRDFIDDKLKKRNILDFNSSLNIDLFQFVTALGLDEPSRNFQNNKNGFGFILLSQLKTVNTVLLGTILLGKAKSSNEIDELSDLEANYIEAEKCAETGFEILKAKIAEANDDEELLIKRMMVELDKLYQQNMK